MVGENIDSVPDELKKLSSSSDWFTFKDYSQKNNKRINEWYNKDILVNKAYLDQILETIIINTARKEFGLMINPRYINPQDPVSKLEFMAYVLNIGVFGDDEAKDICQVFDIKSKNEFLGKYNSNSTLPVYRENFLSGKI